VPRYRAVSFAERLRPWVRGAAAVAALALAGWALRSLERPVWEAARPEHAALNASGVGDALGQGLALGVLGGFRSITADLLWLEANRQWMQQAPAKTVATIRLVTRLDPDTSYFWINGARMIAYDMPHWRIDAIGGRDELSEKRIQEINARFAEQGIDMMREALRFDPGDPRYQLEIGQILLNRLDDVAGAAEWFARAARQPEAPPYAARIYAELLARLGRRREARAFLIDHWRDLPDRRGFDPRLILRRIRELEDAMDLPAERRFAPGR